MDVDPKKTKHGGSSPSGLVLPMGLEKLQPAVPEGMVLVPQEVVDAREQAKKREERALQLERRRVALEIVPSVLAPLREPLWLANPSGPPTRLEAGAPIVFSSPEEQETPVETALRLADELIAKTGGGI